MVRWIILAVLVVVVAATVPLAVSYLPADVGSPVPSSRPREETGPPPSAVVEGEPKFSFGLMSEKDEGEHSWTVRNEGEGPLSIRFAEKPCTCTGVRYGDEGKSMAEGEAFVIEPGGRGTITVRWETRDKIGAFSTFARFATNDYEKSPTLTLTVEGIVTPAIVVDPPRLDFAPVASDEEATLTAAIFSPTRPGLAITDGPRTSRPEAIVPELRPMTEEEIATYNAERAPQVMGGGHEHALGVAPDMPGAHSGPEVLPKIEAGYMLTLTVKPGLPLGRFADSVTLTTDDPIRPRLEIPVSGGVVGPISAMPERVYLPGVPSSRGRATTVSLNVRNQDRTRFDVRIPESLRDVLEVSIDPEPTSPEGEKFRQYRMELRVPPGAKTGVHKGTVVLQTDHPQAGEVKVPVELLVRGG